MNRKPIHALILGTASLLAALAAGSCTEEYTPDNKTDDGRIEVRIAAPTTRTSIADDGMNGLWTKGDKIALWARSGQTTVLSAETFSLWHSKPDLSDACFTARIAPMQAGTYDYYAVSPAPAAVSGTTVSYDIPSVQDGCWNGALDIMHATAQGTELTAGLNELVLSFRHKVHALRITVPEGRNRFGSAISRLIIDFPQAVAGRMTFDAATADAEATLDAVSNSITIDFPTPIDEGDSFWVFIAPADLSGGEVRFTAFSDDECSTPIEGVFGECAAGRITPVDLTIRESRGKVTWFDYTIDHSQLGEPVDRLTLTLPDGRTFATGDNSRTLTPSAGGEFCFALLSDDVPPMVGETLKSVYDTESATVEDRVQPISIPSGYTPDTHNKLTAKAPYLFFEDFSLLAGYDINGGNVSTKEPSAQVIGDTFYYSGWTGNHTKGESGAISIRSRRETALRETRGRVDSAPVSTLKAGKSVNVAVSFRYGSSKESCNFTLDMNYGYTTQQGPIKAYQKLMGSESGTAAQNAESVSLDEQGSFTNLPHEIQGFLIPGCTSAHRMTWELKISGGQGTSKNGWLYIDDVRMTIVH